MSPVRWGLRTPLPSLRFPPSLKEPGFHSGWLNAVHRPWDGAGGSEGAKWRESAAGHTWAEREAGTFLLVLT